MATKIFLGEPPADIKQWIIDHTTPPGPAGHSETIFTLQGGTVETYNITGLITKQWMIDNGYLVYNSEWDGYDWQKEIAQVEIGNTVTSIGDKAFQYSNIASVDFGSGVTTIGDSAFSDCWGLASVTIPSNMRTVGNSAFEKCGNLTSLTINEGVTTIGNGSFCDLENLSGNLVIPNSVITISQGAFANNSLTSLTIGSGVTSIAEYAFMETNLKTITVLGKTTAQAQDLLANTGVPEECTIIGELG